MTEQSTAPTDAPDEPGGEVFTIHGEERTVPRRIEAAGRAAIQQWVDAQVTSTPTRTARPGSPAPAKPAVTTDAPTEG